MANYTVTITLPEHVRGDRWVGITQIGPVLINGAQPAATLARVRMHLAHQATGAVFTLDTDPSADPDAPITITNATTWVAVIPEVQEFVEKAGQWIWDMEFHQTGSAGPLTLYSGVLQVNEDITR
jgi:hypothetical protein